MLWFHSSQITSNSVPRHLQTNSIKHDTPLGGNFPISRHNRSTFNSKHQERACQFQTNMGASFTWGASRVTCSNVIQALQRKWSCSGKETSYKVGGISCSKIDAAADFISQLNSTTLLFSHMHHMLVQSSPYPARHTTATYF